MANSDKNIVIIPNRNQPGQPNVVFTGNSNVPMTLRVTDDNSLSFENVTGQLFSISNNVTSGSIFSVNDISGIPVINVDASGNISLSAFGGNVGIGTASPTSPLHVFGNIRIGNTSTTSGVVFPDGTFQNTAASPGAFSASNVTVTSTNTNATFYPAFVEATTGNIGIRVDTGFTYNPNTEALSLTGNLLIQNGGRFGNLSVTNSTAATSTTTGALTVAGGVGVAGTLFAGNGTVNGIFQVGTASNRYANITSSGGNFSNQTLRFDDNSSTAVFSYQNYALTNIDQGLGMTFQYGAGGSLGATAGGIHFLSTADWSVAGNRSSKVVIQGITAGVTGTILSGTIGAVNVTGSMIAGGTVQGANVNVTGANLPTNGLYLPTTNTLGFVTNSTEKMRISANGNLLLGGSIDNSFRLEVTNYYLGTAANSVIQGGRFTTSTGNADHLEIMNVRNQVGGTNWTSAGWRLQQKVDTTWMGYIQFNGTSSNVGVGTTNNYGITFGAGSTSVDPNAIPEAMRITSIGRVGIGTTVPASLLHLNGALTYGGVTLDNSVTGTGSMVLSASPTLTGTLTATAANFSGNVGIGITNPGIRLGISDSTGTSSLVEAISTSATGAVQVGTFVNATEASGTSNTGDALFRIGITNEATRPYLNINVRRRSIGNYGEIQTTSGTTSTLTTLSIQPLGGKVGIGSTSPTQTLEVQGTTLLKGNISIVGNIYTASSTQVGNLSITNTTASTSTTTGALTVAGGVGVADGMIAGGLVQGANLNVTGSNLPSNGLYLPTANTLGFATNSTEKMRINSSGNVGIGLTNPLATLHSGNSLTDANFTFSTVGAIITSKVTNQRSAQSNVLVLSRSGQSGIVYAGLAMFDMSAWTFDSVWARTQLDIKLSNTLSNDLTNVITFRSDGRVGIGSSVPAQTLDVVGTVAISSNLTVGGTIFGVVNTAINASNIVVTSTATNATFYPAFVEATSGNIGIRADSMLTFNPNTNQLSLTGNAAIQNSLAVGNLSITNTTASTSTTTGALTVAGGVGISGSIQVLGSVNAINANINSSSSTVPINGIWSPAANTLGFSTGGSERARIDSNGNLSIGTSTSTWNTVPARASVFGAKDLTNSAGGAGDQLAIVDSSTAAQGVGGGINLFGNYTGTTPALGAMIDTYKSNSTAGNFGFDLRFHTRLHGTALIQERMRITSTGGVSIGLTANQNMLDVVGGVAIGNYAGNVAAGSNNLIISGQVGIGTSNPSLRGSTTDLVLGKPSTDAGLWIAMNREGTSNVGIGASSGYMQFYVDTLSAGYAWSINGSGYSLLGGYNAMYLRNGKLLVGGGGPSSASSNVDVYGNMVIGRIYAGNSATSGPADGLAVQGQVGIGTTVLATAAKLQIEGNVYVANSSVLVGNISVTNTTISTSTTTGALTVAGGVGVVGNVFAGRISTANSGQFGNIGISNTTSSISTSTGALIVQGGIGIAGNVYTSNAYITSNVGIGTSDLIGSVVRIYANNSTDTLRIRQDGTGNSLVISDTANDTTPFIIDRDGKVGIGTFPPNDKLEVWGNVRITESSRIGNLSITNATVSTSTTTGALIVQGGIGVVGNVFAGRISTANSGQFGNVGINNTTVSTSTTTGALTVAGGVGIANGIVTAGNVGIGTSSTTGYTNNALAVFGRALNRGNIYVTNSSTISGIMFSDGTFQNTAAYRSAQTVISYTTANSSTTTFSSSPYTSANSYVQLYVNGVYQPSAYYTWSGTTVTTTTPAPNGAVVELVITTASTLTTSVTFAQTLAAVSLRL